MNSIPLFHQLLELLAKSAILLTATALLAATWRRGSAAQRHTLWLGAFIALLLLPLSKLAAPHWRLPGSPAAATIVVIAAPADTAVDWDTAPAVATPAPSPALRWPDTSHLLIGLWLAGAAALLAYRVLGSVQIARLRRRSTPLDDARTLALAREAAAELGLTRNYELRLAAARVPCTWGVRRPVVLLPADGPHWNDARLLAALRHELGHIARRDYLARWLGQIVCALYWPNPLVWLAARALHSAQEQACDDLVLRAGTPAPEYAALLFDAASACAQSGLKVRHAVAMARPSTLEGRVLAIVDETRDRRPAGRAAAVASAFVVVATLGLSALAQVASEAPGVPAPAVPGAATQIQIEAKFVEVAAGKWPEARTGSVATKSAEQAAAMLREFEQRSGVDLLSAPRLITKSGQAAHIQIGNEEKLPKGTQPPTKFVGISLEVVPTLAAGAIQLDAKAKLVSRRAALDAGGAPGFHERTSAANVSLPPGQTIVFGAGAGEKPDREVLIFITASVIVPGAATGAPTIPRVEAPQKGAEEPSSAAAHIDTALSKVIPPTFSYAETAKIILPKLEFRGATVEEGVEFLRRKSRDLDPTGLGINLVIKADKETSDRRLSLSLANVPLSEAVRYFASLANLEVVYEPHAIVLRPAAPAFAKEPFTLQSKDGILVKTGQGTLRDIPGVQPITGTITIDPATGAANRKPAFTDIPIDITANETHFENGVAVASGDVKLTYGNTVVSAGTGTLRYDPATRSVRTDGPSKVELDHPAVPGLPGAARPVAAARPLDVEEKANAIIIPKLEFRETTLREAVDFLMKKSRELDPEKKGITIIVPKDLPPAQSDTRITISLTNIPVFEALKYITSLAGMKFKVTESGIVIAPIQTEAPTGLRP